MIKSLIKNDLPAKDLLFNRAKFNVSKAFSASLNRLCLISDEVEK